MLVPGLDIPIIMAGRLSLFCVPHSVLGSPKILRGYMCNKEGCVRQI